MAEFQVHLSRYDNDLEEVKRQAGDATQAVSKFDERLQVLRRNVTSLKGGLAGVQMDHRDTANSLDLLTTVSWH